jgi:hypothetical protein
MARGETPDLPWTEQIRGFAYEEPIGEGLKYPEVQAGLLYDFSKFAENVKSARILREETLREDGKDTPCYVIEVFHSPSENDIKKSDPPPETVWIDKNRSLVMRLAYQGTQPAKNSRPALNLNHIVSFNSYKLNVDPPAWLVSANADFANATASRRAAKVGKQAADFKVHDLNGPSFRCPACATRSCCWSFGTLVRSLSSRDSGHPET